MRIRVVRIHAMDASKRERRRKEKKKGFGQQKRNPISGVLAASADGKCPVYFVRPKCLLYPAFGIQILK